MNATEDRPPDQILDELADLDQAAQERVHRLWDLLGDIDFGDISAPSTEEAWNSLISRISRRPPTLRSDSGFQGPKMRIIRLGFASAAIAATLLVGVVWWRQPVEIYVPPGRQQFTQLPDGTEVQLNSDSSLRYRRAFRDWPIARRTIREVYLEGEAFFNVVRSQNVFTVSTYNARIEVLGTEFNVRSRPGGVDDETRITLATGSVRLSSRSGTAAPMVLNKQGQAARLRGSSVTQVEAIEFVPGAIEHEFAWTEQGFAALSLPLKQIVAELERRFGLSIDIEAGVAAEDSLTLLYPTRASIEGILHDVCLLQSCSYRRTSTGFALIPAEL